MIKRKTIILLCILLSGCESPFREEEHWLVGRFKILQSEAAQRLQIVQIFYPQNNITDAGFIQLKNAYTMAAVLENNGHLINDHKLTNEANRIDASTRDPKTLNRIKDIFLKYGSLDKEAYFRVFILPSYVERALSSVFLELPLHRQTLKRAQDFYSSVIANPETLTSTAEKLKYDLGKFCISSLKGFTFFKKKEERKVQSKKNSIIDMSKVPNEKMRDLVMSEMTNTNDALVSKWFSEIVAPSNTGAIVTKIVDYYSSWMVLRLVSKAKDRACFESVTFPKETLESWMEKEMVKVTVKHVSK